TLLTLIIALVLIIRNVRGNFIWTIAIGTGIAWLFGLVDTRQVGSSSFSFANYGDEFGAMSFGKLSSLRVWIETFSL
ncbi:NCS2 family permease, partial [Bacillus cereus]|nr:NCS2 family permease [Bacillus cereus]